MMSGAVGGQISYRDRSNSDISSQNEEYKVGDSSFSYSEAKYKENEQH
jgi:hypothetical protein